MWIYNILDESVETKSDGAFAEATITLSRKRSKLPGKREWCIKEAGIKNALYAETDMTGDTRAISRQQVPEWKLIFARANRRAARSAAAPGPYRRIDAAANKWTYWRFRHARAKSRPTSLRNAVLRARATSHWRTNAIDCIRRCARPLSRRFTTLRDFSNNATYSNTSHFSSKPA